MDNILLAYATKEQIANSTYSNRQGQRIRLFNTQEHLATQPALFQEDTYAILDPSFTTIVSRASRKQFKQYIIGHFLSTSIVIKDLIPDLAPNPKYRKLRPTGNRATDLVII
jgi:hypothetical protein